MENQYEALEELLGPTEDAPKQEPAAVPAEEEEDLSSASEGDINTEEDESDEEESEDSPQDKGKPESIPFHRFEEVNEARKQDRVKYEATITEYNKLFNDPAFLAHRAEQLKANPQATQPVQVTPEIPVAPIYPNTQAGYSRMVTDQEAATDLLPELLTDETLKTMVQGLVSNKERPLTYVEATREVIKRMGLKAAELKKEGAKEAEEAIARKSRLSSTERPRAGSPSKTDQLRKDLKSKSETTRMVAGAELLGL